MKRTTSAMIRTTGTATASPVLFPTLYLKLNPDDETTAGWCFLADGPIDADAGMSRLTVTVEGQVVEFSPEATPRYRVVDDEGVELLPE